jgi:hypothetical protein
MILAPIIPSGPFYSIPDTNCSFSYTCLPGSLLQPLTGKQLQSGIGLEVSTTACIPHIYKKHYA